MSRPFAVAALIGVSIYASAILLFPKASGRVVTGDATHHFVQLRSIVYDRDLHFRNEYVRIYGLEGGEVEGTEWIFSELTSTGHVRNYMPVGPAIAWAPLYVTAAGVLAVRAWLTDAPAPDGYETVLQLMPGVTGLLASVVAAWLTWRWIQSTGRESSAGWAVAGIWLGSHALYYTLVSPSYSHALSILTGAAFLSHWWSWRAQPSARTLLLAGLLAGAASLMRWQDALWLGVVAIEVARWRAPLSERALGLAAAGVGFAIAFSPQMIVWHVLYGAALTVPQGSGFMEWTSPNLVAVLVSDNHGLLSWTPVFVLSLAGLWTFGRRHVGTGLVVAYVLLASWYVNSAVADWWAGEAFGARRFLSLAPLFAVGLGHWLAPHGTLSKVRASIVALAIGLNGLLLFQYQVFMKGWRDIAPYPKGFVDLWLMRFVVPFRVLGRWLA